MAAENFKVKKGLEVGTGITANSDGINVTGIVTATQFRGDGSGLTGVVASGTGIVIKEEGTSVGTAGTINFVGSNILATLSEGTATVTVNSGALDNVVEDTTPQLGGNLDLNSKFLTGSGGINVTGVVTATTLKGNGDFVDIDVDGQTELDDLNVSGISTFGGALDVNSNIDVDGHTELDDLRVSGVSTFIGAMNVANGSGVIEDAGDQLKIRATRAGAASTLAIGANKLFLRNKDGNENYLEATDNGSVKLYFDGNQKLTTTINGIEVPDLNVTGVGTVGRLDTSGVTLGTNSTTFAAKFADNAVANFGTDNDLKISHDDTHARITNTTGDIVVSGIISATSDVKVGSAITMDPTSGIITATSFSGSGANLTNIPSAQLTGALPALDGSALTNVTGSGSGIVIQHDGTIVGTAGTINFSTNLDVSAISAGIVTVTAAGGGGSASQNLFSTIAVSGQNDIVADATTDTLTFAEGNNITITTNESTDTITIASDQISTEEIQDIVGAMFSSNTETDITATYQDDDGTIDLEVDLSSLPAENLTGTIANGRFPTTLPAVSGANLTNLNADNISSGDLGTDRIENDAVTFAKMQNVGSGVLIGRNDNGTGDMEALTAFEARTLLNVADGATNNSPSDTDIQVTYDIAGGAGSGYEFTGPGYDTVSGNPDLYLVRGQRYRFINTTGTNHPFAFRNGANDANYTTGITGSQSGTQDFNVPYDAPEHLMYRCTIHQNSMKGNIYIIGGKQSGVGIGTIVGILTATGFSGSGANLTGLTASQIPFINADKIDSGTFNDARIPNLNASKITAGTFDAARIPTNLDTTGTAAGLTGTPDITVNNVVGAAATFSGITTVTGETLFTKQLSVAGVSTFAGITTVTGSTLFAKDVSVSGVVTATTFVGALTGNASGSSGSCSGNAATATKLANARNIGGVSFDGSAAIDLPGVNSAGDQDTSGNAATATKLATARNIGGVSFDGSAAIDLPGVNAAGDQDTSGNAATATKLATARNIGGVSFDGSAAIDLPGVNSAGDQDTSGNAATATALADARNIGGVSFDGTANINLPGVNQAGTQNTSGTAGGLSGTPDITVNNVVGAAATFSGITTVTGSVEVGTVGVGIGVTLDQGGGVYSGIVTATKFSGSGEDLTGLTASQIPNLAASKITSGTFNAARIPTLNQDTTGNAATADKVDTIKKDDLSTGYLTFVADNNTNATAETVFTATGITVDSGEDKITATTFVGALTGSASGSSGSCTGNSATATALETARNIGGVSFDGTSSIDLPGVNTAGDQNTSGDAGGLSGTPDIDVRNVVGVAATFSGNVEVTGDLTVNGTTTTLDTNLIDVDKIEVTTAGTNVAVAVTQNGTGDILKLYDDTTEVFSVADGGNVTSTGELTATKFIKTTNSAGFLKADGTEDTNTYLTSQTSHADVLVDGDFTSQGFMVRGASAGVYSIDSNTYQTSLTFSTGITNSSGTVTVDSAVQTSVAGSGSNTNAFVIDTIALNSFKLLEYTIHITHSSGIQAQKLLVMCDGTSGSDHHTEFAVMFSSSLLGTFTTSTNGSNVEVKFDPVNTSTTVKFIKQVVV